jgi:hypothetical protein
MQVPVSGIMFAFRNRDYRYNSCYISTNTCRQNSYTESVTTTQVCPRNLSRVVLQLISGTSQRCRVQTDLHVFCLILSECNVTCRNETRYLMNSLDMLHFVYLHVNLIWQSEITPWRKILIEKL